MEEEEGKGGTHTLYIGNKRYIIMGIPQPLDTHNTSKATLPAYVLQKRKMVIGPHCACFMECDSIPTTFLGLGFGRWPLHAHPSSCTAKDFFEGEGREKAFKKLDGTCVPAMVFTKNRQTSEASL